MKIHAFVKPERVVLGLTATNREEVLRHLIQPLAKDGVVEDADIFLDDLIRREGEFTTAIENGVAIPHARSAVVHRLGLAVGIADSDGIQFDPSGESRSRLFFCIAIPKTAPTAHMPLLRALASFARDCKRIEKLMALKTPAAIARNLGSFKG